MASLRIAECRRESSSDDGGHTRGRMTPRSAAASKRLGYQRSHSGKIASTLSRRLIGGGVSRRRFTLEWGVAVPHLPIHQPVAILLLPQLDELSDAGLALVGEYRGIRPLAEPELADPPRIDCAQLDSHLARPVGLPERLDF